MQPMFRVPESMVDLDGPWECPQCGGHYMFDASYLIQKEPEYLEFRCLYCDVGTYIEENEDDEIEKAVSSK